jgi:uncharacterized protein YhhL (DUF1145 family)
MSLPLRRKAARASDKKIFYLICFFRVNGLLSLIGPNLFGTAAFCLSISANSLCQFVQPETEDFLAGFPLVPESVGLWCYEANNGAQYSLRDIAVEDSKYKAARALGTTANVMGFIIWLVFIFTSCIPVPAPVFYFMSFLCILNCLFQGLVFLIFKSDICDAGCSLDTGGKCAIAATVFWFLTALTSCKTAKKKEPEAENPQPDAEE